MVRTAEWAEQFHPARSSTVRARLALTDTWLLELFLALWTIVWGAQILNPWTDAFSAVVGPYVLLARVPGGELVVGAAMTMLGVLKLRVVLTSPRQSRAAVMAAGGVVWIALTAVIMVPTHGAGGAVPLLVAFANWFCWARLRYRGHDQ